MDRYLMEGHKLFWHLDRIISWQEGERVVPLHMDIGISKGCTIGCVYCYGVFQGRIGPRGSFIPREPLLEFIQDAAEIGIKAVSITGEAEPTMNPALYETVALGHKLGLDLGLATWGGRIEEDKISDLARNLIWIRFNLSAADEENYQKIHRTTKDNFRKVIGIIEKFVTTKRKLNLPLTVGLQMVVMPWYAEEAIKLAKLGKELSVDYLEIKHCSEPFDGGLGVKFADYRDQKIIDFLKESETYSTDNYDVIVRWKKILKGKQRNYDICNAAGNFMLRMSGDGWIYPCAQFFDLRSDEFKIGNIVEQSFKDIFYSSRYAEVMQRIQQLNVHKECYSGCKEDAINEFLWNLKNPSPHINFV